MSGPVSYARQGRVGVITVDNPPVNALSQPVRKGIIDGLDQGLADDGVAAIVLTAAGRTFIAGADITEFNKPLMEPDLNTVVNRLEDSGKPVVVALFGTTLGGGLEVALGCHYRVAVADAACGLPEVKLGIIPGAGGTQRLPRVAGVQAAIDMIPSGRFIPAAEAHAMGLVDAIVDTPVTDAAIAFAENLIAQGKGARKSRDGTGLSDAAAALAALDAALPTVTKAARGQMSPVQALDAIRLAVTEAEFFDGLKGERRIFEDLRASDQSKALRHMFFAERDAQKVPGIDKSTPTRPIAAAGVIGAGTMGGGIAMAFANAGIPVTVVERDQAALARGLGVVEANYRATAAKGKLTDAQVAERLALITGTTDPGQLAQADIIIEAVFERLDAKQEIFRILDGIAKPGAILASNTSTLDIDRIAGATGRPADVIGTHFFSPANVMRLLELVRGRETAPEVIATAMKLGKALKKIPVLVGNCDGFVGNRMINKYTREADFLLEEGATPEQVDRVMTGWGLAMGPFQMSDLAGLDIGWEIRKRQNGDLPLHERYSAIPDRLCEKGWFGQKTGRGFYRYGRGSRTPQPDPEVAAIIQAVARDKGVPQRTIPDDEVFKRLIWALANEGARILEEGMALRASDIDVIYVNGYGFPAWRSGPMFQADLTGLDKVLADITGFEARFGPRWAPAPLLVRLAGRGGTFRDLGLAQAAA